jgi:predicted enzyme related to lactoylglutathione lyase
MTIRTTAWPSGTPCWVDLAVPDVSAATAFYREVMGWTFVDTGEEFGHYHIAQTGGHAAAAIGPIMQEGQPAAWTVYLASEDADATAKLITDNGGAIMGGPMDIPGSGRMLIAQDAVGGTFGVWQAAGMVGAEIVNEPGSVTWTDARLTDTEAGKTFYAAVFDYEYTPMPGAPDDYSTFSVDGEVRGGIGGMMGAPAAAPSHWLTWFSVADVDAAVAAVEAAGGSVVSPIADTPFGRMGVVTDPFGAGLGLHTAPAAAG